MSDQSYPKRDLPHVPGYVEEELYRITKESRHEDRVFAEALLMLLRAMREQSNE